MRRALPQGHIFRLTLELGPECRIHERFDAGLDWTRAGSERC